MNLIDEYRSCTVALEEAKAALERDGVAVVPAVIQEDELPSLRESMWGTFETLTQGRLQRADPSTFAVLSEFLPIHSMLYQHWKLGHAQYVWDVRSAAGVITTFSTLWDTPDLITSFDGVSLHLPFEDTKKGAVNLYDVDAGDATTRVLTGSYKLHKQYMEHCNIDTRTSDWSKFPKNAHEEHLDFFLKRGLQRKRKQIFDDKRMTTHLPQQAKMFMHAHVNVNTARSLKVLDEYYYQYLRWTRSLSHGVIAWMTFMIEHDPQMRQMSPTDLYAIARAATRLREPAVFRQLMLIFWDCKLFVQLIFARAIVEADCEDDDMVDWASALLEEDEYGE
ncbi:hypothetical protein JKP88DRAFT_251619 [Tribonema minus]|uniref:Uncharacterized protein n=1 Tax=Tribonema minus TaxID=303371 RepID=A0A835ZCM1_9STRA|nr:hypothetical protein JKP88DRAFT_251619 [Tribonema minus]